MIIHRGNVSVQVFSSPSSGQSLQEGSRDAGSSAESTNAPGNTGGGDVAEEDCGGSKGPSKKDNGGKHGEKKGGGGGSGAVMCIRGGAGTPPREDSNWHRPLPIRLRPHAEQSTSEKMENEKYQVRPGAQRKMASMSRRDNIERYNDGADSGYDSSGGWKK